MSNPTAQLFYTGPSAARYVQLLRGSGGELPFYKGVTVHRGRGLVGDIFRQYAMPIISKAAPHILRGVTGLISDIAKGKPVKQAVKKRGARTIKRTAKDVLRGTGKKKKRKYKKKTTVTARMAALRALRGKGRRTRRKPTKKPKKKAKKRRTRRVHKFTLFD